ncbi:metalloregulator ArsR/SmtB family transcription factor [Winogradskyella maritima]|nr:metalloregulator ArsR/SmtB family transcription factor [Winogradskyella maritima]
MGASKLNMYSNYHNDVASIAKVFAHPARVAIIAYISKQESCICNDIVEEIGLSQATVSQHLEVINKAGLIRGTFKGTRKCYCINVDRLQDLKELMNSFFYTTAKNCC